MKLPSIIPFKGNEYRLSMSSLHLKRIHTAGAAYIEKVNKVISYELKESKIATRH
jgi:hypothetical protein